MNLSSVFPAANSQSIEKAMQDLGITYTEEVIEISQISATDNSFQTRTNVAVVDDRVVDEYVEDIKNGDLFPKIVVIPHRRGRYVVVCGRHRAKAFYKAQDDVCHHISAYVVDEDSDESALKALSVRENNANGVRQSKSENIRVAVDYLKGQPVQAGCFMHKSSDIAIVAKKFRVHKSTLLSHYKASLVLAKIVECGIPAEDFNTTTCLNLFHWYENNQDGFVDLVKAINGCSVQNVGKLLQEARKDNCTIKEIVSRIGRDSDATKKRCSFDFSRFDMVDRLKEHLSLALHDIESIGSSGGIDEERASEIIGLVHEIKKQADAWGACK